MFRVPKSGKHAYMRMPDPQFNRLTVLKKLRAAEPVSRTDLAHLSGLTGGSITAIVGDLVDRGLVLEEVAPGLTAEDVQRATGARLIVSKSLRVMEG